MSCYFYKTIQSTQTSEVGVVTAAYSLSVLADVPSSPERLGRSYTKPQHMSAPHRTDRIHTSWGHKVPTSEQAFIQSTAASSSGAQAGIKELLFCYRYSWQPTFTLHLQCSMPESLRSTGLSERVMRFIHQRANTVQRNSNMSHIWLQALFICKPRFHHWLTCLHWLLINELQKFVMHESFIWAGVTQTAGFPRDLRTPRGAELKVKRDHPSAASQSPDSLTDLWPFGNDRRIHNCSANAHQQGGQGGVEVPRRITQTTKKHAV